MTDERADMTAQTCSDDDGSQRGDRKVREGLVVVSDKMDKTVVVAVEDRVQARRCTARSSAARASSRRTTRPNAVRHRRPGPDHGDPAAVGHQALARRSRSSRRPSKPWASPLQISRSDPPGSQATGNRRDNRRDR